MYSWNSQDRAEAERQQRIMHFIEQMTPIHQCSLTPDGYQYQQTLTEKIRKVHSGGKKDRDRDLVS